MFPKYHEYGLSIGVGSVSAIIAVIAAVELIINASSNTWIRIILGIVGLILILVGTAFIIYGIIKGFDGVGNLITSNALLKKLKKR
jgi:glucan phosphoethanolaminetransferase (alkaline phosphatase superfamily)